ncbi:hypothetical protein YC2023_029422 [Brassica napus]
MLETSDVYSFGVDMLKSIYRIVNKAPRISGGWRNPIKNSAILLLNINTTTRSWLGLFAASSWAQQSSICMHTMNLVV